MTPDEFMLRYGGGQAGVATNAPAQTQIPSSPAPAQTIPWTQAALGGMTELGGSISGALQGNPIGGTLGRLSSLGTKAGIGSIPIAGQLADQGLGQDYHSLKPINLGEHLLSDATSIGSTVAQLNPAQAGLMSSLPGLAKRDLGTVALRGGLLGAGYGGFSGATRSGVDQTTKGIGGKNLGLSLSAPASMLPKMILESVKEAIPSAAQFAAFEAGGLFGAKLGAKAAPLKVGEGIVKKFGPKTAQTIHEASARAGQAAVGALTGFGTALLAGALQEEQVAQALLGGGLGLITPAGTQRIQKKEARLPTREITPENMYPGIKKPLQLEGPTQEVWNRINAKTEQLYQFQKEQRTSLEIEKYIRMRLRDKNLNENLVMDTTPIQDAIDYLRLADHHATQGDPTMAQNYISLANKLIDDLANSNRAILLSAKNPTPEDIAAKKIVDTKGPVGYDKLQQLADYLGIKASKQYGKTGPVFVIGSSPYNKTEAFSVLSQAYQDRQSNAIKYKTLSANEQRALEKDRFLKDKEIKSKLNELYNDRELRRQAKEKAVQEVLLESWNQKINEIEPIAIEALTTQEMLAQSGQGEAFLELSQNPQLYARAQALGWDPSTVTRMYEKYKGLSMEDMISAEEQILQMGGVPNDAETTLDLFRVFDSLDGKIGGFLDKWLLRPMQIAEMDFKAKVGTKTEEFSREAKAAGFKIKEKPVFGGRVYDKKQVDRFGKYLNGEITGKDLTPSEAATFERGRELYKKYTDQIFNTMKPILKKLGYGELNYRENYFAWYREAEGVESLFKQTLQDQSQGSIKSKAQEIPYRHMMRKGNDPVNLIDPFRALELVLADAARLQSYEPLVQKGKFLAERSKEYGRQDVSNLMTRLADGMIGIRLKHAYDTFFTEHPAGKFILGLTNNFIGNILTTFNPVLNQTLGLPAITGELGASPFKVAVEYAKANAQEFWGMFARKAIDPSSLSNYLQYSNFAKARELAHHNSLSERPGLVENAFAGAYQYFDRVVGATAWNLGYEKANTKLKLSHEDSVRYADLIASRTQGVFDTLLKPRLLQGPLGKVLAPLSTGTFAAFNTLVPDTIQNSKLSKYQKASRIGSQIGMTMAIQLALGALYGGSNDPMKYLEDAILAQIPVLGGLVRSGISGPIGTVGRFVDSPTPTSLARTISLLSPVKGGYQAVKTFEGIKSLINDGMVYDRNGEPLYQFDTSSIGNVLKSLAFSPSRTAEGRARYAYLDSSFSHKVAKGLDGFLTEMGLQQD